MVYAPQGASVQPSDIPPTDSIVIWNGAIVDIPAGWVVCDGNNATPDLQDKFVVGAGNTHAVDATGGESTHALTESEMASHNHTHTVFDGSASATNAEGTNGDTNFTDIGSSTAGSDSAHENKPPFHALAYIQRVST